MSTQVPYRLVCPRRVLPLSCPSQATVDEVPRPSMDRTHNFWAPEWNLYLPTKPAAFSYADRKFPVVRVAHAHYWRRNLTGADRPPSRQKCLQHLSLHPAPGLEQTRTGTNPFISDLCTVNKTLPIPLRTIHRENQRLENQIVGLTALANSRRNSIPLISPLEAALVARGVGGDGRDYSSSPLSSFSNHSRELSSLSSYWSHTQVHLMFRCYITVSFIARTFTFHGSLSRLTAIQ